MSGYLVEAFNRRVTVVILMMEKLKIVERATHIVLTVQGHSIF